MFNPWLHPVGQGSGIALSCGVGHRCGLDLVLLWLWLRPSAVAPIRPLGWELPYAVGAALKRKKKKKTSLFEIYNFKIYNKALLIIITMLCIMSSEIIYIVYQVYTLK